MNRRASAIVALAAVAMCLPGCSPKPKTESERSTQRSDAEAALRGFVNADPSLQGVLDRSVGYAVIPDVGKAGFIAGGAYGRGVVYEHGAPIGYVDLTQGTVGLQIGAETYDELIIFEDREQLDRLKSGEFSFSGNVSAVAVKPGAAAATMFQDGVAVFTRTKGGVMAEASVGGQKFSYRPM